MFSQADIDAVLNDAQQAVNQLASATGASVATVEPPRAVTPAPVAAPAASRGEIRALAAARLLKLRVPIRVRLATRRMPLRDILQIGFGALLEFEKPVTEELELRVNNKCIGTGEAVKIGENFGLKVRFIGDVRTRLASVTSDEPA